MDIHCFNMAVRILARHEVQLLRDIPSHYMDLNFCVSYYNHVLHFFLIALMFHYARDSSHGEHMEIATLKRLFHSWPDSNDYHISQCDMVRFFSFVIVLYLVLINILCISKLFHHCRFYCLGICLGYLYCLSWIKIEKLSQFSIRYQYLLSERMYLKPWPTI